MLHTKITDMSVLEGISAFFENKTIIKVMPEKHGRTKGKYGKTKKLLGG